MLNIEYQGRVPVCYKRINSTNNPREHMPSCTVKRELRSDIILSKVSGSERYWLMRQLFPTISNLNS